MSGERRRRDVTATMLEDTTSDWSSGVLQELGIGQVSRWILRGGVHVGETRLDLLRVEDAHLNPDPRHLCHDRPDRFIELGWEEEHSRPSELRQLLPDVAHIRAPFGPSGRAFVSERDHGRLRIEAPHDGTGRARGPMADLTETIHHLDIKPSPAQGQAR